MKVMPHIKKKLRYFEKLNLLYCSYVIICSIIISYFIVNSRLKHNMSPNYLFHNKYRHIYRVTDKTTKSMKNSSMKYILLWTNPENYPFVYFGEGNSIFANKSCKYTNCYVTANRKYLGHYTEFEVIAFNGPQLPLLIHNGDLPTERNLHQKYVYANVESAANYPFRDQTLNNFFNWTWTYKLNSDGYWGYIIIKDANKNIIGPRKDMHWFNIEDMDVINNDLKLRLQTKKKTAAWMCSYCLTSSHREIFVQALQQYLEKFNLKIDIYGECGDHQCPKTIMSRCLRMIRKTYYFYLAFENSLSDDYVTEKILYALKYDTIPIVYGGANYSRFLPEGSYLDAVKLGPKKLADTMFEIINNRTLYYNYFKWKNYYSYHSTHENPETDSYCQFCAMVNNETLINEHKTYEKFNSWWMYKVTKVL